MGLEPDTPKGGLVPNARHALPAGLARAMRFLEQRLDEPIQLDALAAAAGVRPRTLEAHFKAYLGTTPLGWLRRQRLARARQQLLAADDRKSVTDVALANGFSELGRFAAQYRGQFGELPSQTLRAARGNRPNPADELADEALRLSGRALVSAFVVGPGPCGVGSCGRRTCPGAGAAPRFAQGDCGLVLESARRAQFQQYA